MLLKRITRLSQVLALMAIVLGVGAFYEAKAAVAGGSVAAFDDDDDKRKKNRGQRGDQRRDQRGDKGEKRGRGRDPQGDSDRESRRQQQRSDQNSRRQQEWSDRNSRQQQWESDRRSRQQQAESDQRSRRQQYESDRGNRNRGYDRGRSNRRPNNDRRVILSAPGGYFGQNRIVVPQYPVVNRRLIREQQRFIKEQTKAQRRYQQDQQRLARNQYGRYSAPMYGNNNGYYANQADYDRGSSWKSQILPMLIANIFGGNSFGDSSGSFNGGYPDQRYSRSNVNPYDYQDRQPAYAYQPSYSNGGYDDQYSYDQPGFDSGSVLSSLPIAEIIEQYTGENEFVSGLIGTFLSQGYDQGMLDGQAARQYGYTDAQYNDPYTDQNGVCDPYSVSLGENRRYLSEGYEQGYRDALEGNEDYIPGNAGNADLVGVLLNSVLAGV